MLVTSGYFVVLTHGYTTATITWMNYTCELFPNRSLRVEHPVLVETDVGVGRCFCGAGHPPGTVLLS